MIVHFKIPGDLIIPFKYSIEPFLCGGDSLLLIISSAMCPEKRTLSVLGGQLIKSAVQISASGETQPGNNLILGRKKSHDPVSRFVYRGIVDQPVWILVNRSQRGRI